MLSTQSLLRAVCIISLLLWWMIGRVWVQVGLLTHLPAVTLTCQHPKTRSSYQCHAVLICNRHTSLWEWGQALTSAHFTHLLLLFLNKHVDVHASFQAVDPCALGQQAPTTDIIINGYDTLARLKGEQYLQTEISSGARCIQSHACSAYRLISNQWTSMLYTSLDCHSQWVAHTSTNSTLISKPCDHRLVWMAGTWVHMLAWKPAHQLPSIYMRVYSVGLFYLQLYLWSA